MTLPNSRRIAGFLAITLCFIAVAAIRQQMFAQTQTATLVGIVLPADSKPGERVSGSVVTDPASYQGIPALRVETLSVPLSRDASGKVTLRGMVMSTGDGKSQPAEDGWSTVVPPNGKINIGVGPVDQPSQLVKKDIPVATPSGAQPQTPASPAPTGPPNPSDFETPPVYVNGAVQVIRGPVDGDRATTNISIDARLPARVIAESPRATYFKLPDGVAAGSHRVVMREGGGGVSFPVVVLTLTMSADKLELRSGESTKFSAVVSGPQSLPQSAWRPGLPSDLVDIASIRRFMPKFQPPSSSDAGNIFLAIDNGSRDTVSISPANNEMVVSTLGRSAFGSGPYEYHGVVKSKRSGRFTINSLVVALFAPIEGDPVDATGTEPRPVLAKGPTKKTTDGVYCHEELLDEYPSDRFVRADSANTSCATVRSETGRQGWIRVLFHCRDKNKACSTTITIKLSDETIKKTVNCKPS